MGMYLEGLNHHHKAQQLVADYGGTLIDPPARNALPPRHRVLICVATNPGFDAAVIITDQLEFKRIWTANHYDHERPTQWLTVPIDTVRKLAPWALPHITYIDLVEEETLNAGKQEAPLDTNT